VSLTNMNPADFLKAVDHAAGMNDRWLFLAAFCLLLRVASASMRTGSKCPMRRRCRSV
jgi:hypothetical protein